MDIQFHKVYTILICNDIQQDHCKQHLRIQIHHNYNVNGILFIYITH